MHFRTRVLTVHHVALQTLAATPAVKIIENHEGVAYIKGVQIGVQQIGLPA